MVTQQLLFISIHLFQTEKSRRSPWKFSQKKDLDTTSECHLDIIREFLSKIINSRYDTGAKIIIQSAKIKFKSRFGIGNAKSGWIASDTTSKFEKGRYILGNTTTGKILHRWKFVYGFLVEPGGPRDSGWNKTRENLARHHIQQMQRIIEERLLSNLPYIKQVTINRHKEVHHKLHIVLNGIRTPFH